MLSTLQGFYAEISGNDMLLTDKQRRTDVQWYLKEIRGMSKRGNKLRNGCRADHGNPATTEAPEKILDGSLI
jgi:hypothetical protein